MFLQTKQNSLTNKAGKESCHQKRSQGYLFVEYRKRDYAGRKEVNNAVHPVLLFRPYEQREEGNFPSKINPEVFQNQENYQQPDKENQSNLLSVRVLNEEIERKNYQDSHVYYFPAQLVKETPYHMPDSCIWI